MNAARRQAKDHVTCAHPLRTDHLGSVNDAHHEAGEVIVSLSHHAGMLGHLAAHERAAREATALGNATHHLCHVIRPQFAHGNVIQEEERLRP